MPKLIDKINANMQKENLSVRTAKARNWMKQNLKNLRTNPAQMIKDKDNKFVTKIFPGKMYFFSYDPKLKDTLPFYDIFPLVIPIERYTDGFLGLNLHYLPPRYRIVLLDKLYDLFNNDNYDETSKLRISYNLLSGTSRYKEFEPCLKRYLASHIQSRIIEISPNNWEIAALLPTERFIGEKASEVQNMSRQSIMNENVNNTEQENGV